MEIKDVTLSDKARGKYLLSRSCNQQIIIKNSISTVIYISFTIDSLYCLKKWYFRLINET